MPRISHKASTFTESVIREMSRLAARHDAINLAQGFPDFEAPAEIKEAACAAIRADINQYAITWGAKPFRDAIAAKTAHWYPGWHVDPETQITVTCGATEGMMAAMLAILDPGDEIVVFEPFYENYGPDAILSGAVPRYVTLHEPDWSIDPDELRAAFGPRTRGIVVNSPHNPTGKVFTREELELIAELCQANDAVAFTDEIYEHIRYAGEHIPMATLPGHGRAHRRHQRHVQDLLGHGLAHRLGDRAAGAHQRHPQGPRLPDGRRGGAAPAGRGVALAMPDDYYHALGTDYQRLAATCLVPALQAAGFRTFLPDGAYYVMTDIAGLTDEDDVTFARRIVEPSPASPLCPGSSFYSRPELGRSKLRFAFPKRHSTLEAAAVRLRSLGA